MNGLITLVAGFSYFFSILIAQFHINVVESQSGLVFLLLAEFIHDQIQVCIYFNLASEAERFDVLNSLSFGTVDLYNASEESST